MVNFFHELKAEAVIFDFDGVIVNTEPLHYKAFQEILIPLGLGFSWDEYVTTYMGYDDRDAFVEAFKSKNLGIDPDHLATLISRKAVTFQEIIKAGVTAYPGVGELIASLHSRQVPLAICSGALRSDIDPILESLSLSRYFDILVTAEEVVKSKPDPECYALAFQRMCSKWNHLRLSPTSTVAIEDTPAGIKAALLAGLNVIAVTNSYDSSHLNGANLIVESLQQLLDGVHV